MIVRTALLIAFFCPAAVHAGFLDADKDKASQAAQEALEKTLQDGGGPDQGASGDPSKQERLPEPQAPAQPHQTPAEPSIPKAQQANDPGLFKQTQQRLNALGYEAGPGDGVHGPGTAQAIEGFQATNGLSVTGRPSQALLSRLEAAKGKQASAGHASASPASQTAGKLPTSERQIARAIVDLALDILFKRPERGQKHLVKVFFPEEDEIFSDDFAWHERKEELKQAIIKESKNAPKTFKIAPCHKNSPSQGTINDGNLYFLVGEYDFNRNAFSVYYDQK